MPSPAPPSQTIHGCHAIVGAPHAALARGLAIVIVSFTRKARRRIVRLQVSTACPFVVNPSLHIHILRARKRAVAVDPRGNLRPDCCPELDDQRLAAPCMLLIDIARLGPAPRPTSTPHTLERPVDTPDRSHSTLVFLSSASPDFTRLLLPPRFIAIIALGGPANSFLRQLYYASYSPACTSPPNRPAPPLAFPMSP